VQLVDDQHPGADATQHLHGKLLQLVLAGTRTRAGHRRPKVSQQRSVEPHHCRLGRHLHGHHGQALGILASGQRMRAHEPLDDPGLAVVRRAGQEKVGRADLSRPVAQQRGQPRQRGFRPVVGNPPPLGAQQREPLRIGQQRRRLRPRHEMGKVGVGCHHHCSAR